jgi:hypothetical protein
LRRLPHCSRINAFVISKLGNVAVATITMKHSIIKEYSAIPSHCTRLCCVDPLPAPSFVAPAAASVLVVGPRESVGALVGASVGATVDALLCFNS